MQILLAQIWSSVPIRARDVKACMIIYAMSLFKVSTRLEIFRLIRPVAFFGLLLTFSFTEEQLNNL